MPKRVLLTAKTTPTAPPPGADDWVNSIAQKSAAAETATPQTATPQAATPQAATPQAATPQTATPQTAPETIAQLPAQNPAPPAAITPMKRLTIDVSLELHTAIKGHCAAHHLPMADAIRALLEAHFNSSGS